MPRARHQPQHEGAPDEAILDVVRAMARRAARADFAAAMAALEISDNDQTGHQTTKDRKS